MHYSFVFFLNEPFQQTIIVTLAPILAVSFTITEIFLLDTHDKYQKKRLDPGDNPFFQQKVIYSRYFIFQKFSETIFVFFFVGEVKNNNCEQLFTIYLVLTAFVV